MPRELHRKRPALATSMEALGAELSRELLKRYGRDETFVNQVAALVERHEPALVELKRRSCTEWSDLVREAPASPPLRQYLDDLTELAQRWGLSYFPNERGLKALHLWSLRWRGTRKPVVVFGTGLIWRLPVPPLNRLDLSVRVVVEDMWDPTNEPMQVPRTSVPQADQERLGKLTIPPYGAKYRILARCEAIIDAELERIAKAVEAAGFTFEDTAARRDTHLDWTYDRLAHRTGVGAIADAAYLSENAVRKATDRVKEIIGLAGFPTPKRRPKK